MVHLAPLPGAPRFQGSLVEVVDEAVDRAVTLVDAGFEGLIVENFGDAPFFAGSVPPETVAAMTRCVVSVADAVDVPFGVNVLRNDARAAIAVAAATGAAFIRVNVLTGSMHTDQGPIVGDAALVARDRARLSPGTAVWADVFVKHAVPPPGTTLEQSALDTWERGGADALVISGTGTGHAPDEERLSRIAAAVPAAPLVVGSGVDPDNVARFGAKAQHLVVGTCLERDGAPGAPLDAARIERFMDAARAAGVVP